MLEENSDSFHPAFGDNNLERSAHRAGRLSIFDVRSSLEHQLRTLGT
jgi:hypothetical protein